MSPGTAGASARAKAARVRESQAERKHGDIEARPILGRLKHVVKPEPDAGRSWATGAVGEERLGAALDTKVADVLNLHDRRLPRSNANIDHLVIAASGVWVIDAKRYRGRLAKVNKGGWLRSDIRLTVAGRDRTSLVHGVVGQVDRVRAALADDFGDTPTCGALCFVETEWALLTKPFVISEVLVTYPKALYARLATAGPLDAATREVIHRHLASTFPPA